MSLDPLARLNTEQRRAVEYGVGCEPGDVSAPLLVIAGAGSGKTNTLAHRVANLIASGVDPHRILLMTFSRRAASEMSRRVESICSKVVGAKVYVEGMLRTRKWQDTEGFGCMASTRRAIHSRRDAAGLRSGDRLSDHLPLSMPVRIRSFLLMWKKLAQVLPCGLPEASVESLEQLRSCMVRVQHGRLAGLHQMLRPAHGVRRVGGDGSGAI